MDTDSGLNQPFHMTCWFPDTFSIQMSWTKKRKRTVATRRIWFRGPEFRFCNIIFDFISVLRYLELLWNISARFGKRHFLLCLDQSATTNMSVPTVGQSHAFRQQVTLTWYLQVGLQLFLQTGNSPVRVFIDLMIFDWMTRAWLFMEYVFLAPLGANR